MLKDIKKKIGFMNLNNPSDEDKMTIERTIVIITTHNTIQILL